MSTRIYGGIKFASGDFHEVFTRLQEFRDRLVPQTEIMVGSYLASRLTRMVDDTAAQGLPLGENFLSKAVNEFRDSLDEIKKTGRRNPGVDTEFKVSILPYDGQLYGIMFTEQPEWRKLFLAEPWVSEFSYGDASDDTPEGVSYEDYRKRGDLWNAVMPTGAPVNHGVEADLTYNFYWPEWEWIEPHLTAQTLDDRLKEVGQNRVSFAKMKDISGGDDSKYMGSFWEARRWLKTDEGTSAVHAEIERVRPLLPPLLTRGVVDGFSK